MSRNNRGTRLALASASLLTGLMAFALPWGTAGLAAPGSTTTTPPAAATGQATPGQASLALPQAVVQCKGAHALCNASIDCLRSGKDKALCPCWNVNETHLVLTEKIQDELVRKETQRRCTQGSPCGLDDAPVCRVIREGRYRVDKVTYPGVSTFSYRGWCQTFRPVG